RHRRAGPGEGAAGLARATRARPVGIRPRSVPLMTRHNDSVHRRGPSGHPPRAGNRARRTSSRAPPCATWTRRSPARPPTPSATGSAGRSTKEPSTNMPNDPAPDGTVVPATCPAAGPLLLMIGSPVDSTGFAGLASALAGDYTVVTYDPRGIGNSSRADTSQDVTPGQQADDVHRLLSALGGGPASVFGSSGGATVGL